MQSNTILSAILATVTYLDNNSDITLVEDNQHFSAARYLFLNKYISKALRKDAKGAEA